MLRDRYHLRLLRTQREVLTALAYVLLDVRKHRAQRGLATTCCPRATSPVVAAARSWLLCVGWLRWGRIAPDETPAASPG